MIILGDILVPNKDEINDALDLGVIVTFEFDGSEFVAVVFVE